MPQRESLATEQPARAPQTARLDAWLQKIGAATVWRRCTQIDKLSQIDVYCYSVVGGETFLVVISQRRGETPGGGMTPWIDQGFWIYTLPTRENDLDATFAAAERALGLAGKGAGRG